MSSLHRSLFTSVVVCLGLVCAAPLSAETNTEAYQQQEDQNADSDEEDGSEETPPGRDPDTAQARQMAEVGMMSGSGGYLQRGWALDVAVEGGVGGSEGDFVLLGRGMIGPMYVFEPHTFSLLGVAEYQSRTGFAAGGLLQYLSLHTGLFLQTGGVVNLDGEPGFIASAGWQVFGFEYQRRGIGTAESNVFLGKLRVPITWLYRAFQ